MSLKRSVSQRTGSEGGETEEELVTDNLKAGEERLRRVETKKVGWISKSDGADMSE